MGDRRYDADLNLLYYGTGNPNPDYYGADRKGDNSIPVTVAIDADTGKLRWHCSSRRTISDWDSAHVPCRRS